MSTSPNRRPRHVASSSIRSRVTPGSSCAIAARLPNRRFTRVDLPTFWRPTIAICGTRALTTRPPARSRRARSQGRVERLVDRRGRSCRSRWRPAPARGGFVRASRASRSRSASRTVVGVRRSALARPAVAPLALATARRKSLRGASGNTTVAMSRPSITAPVQPSVRCRSRISARTAGWRATTDTLDSTSGVVQLVGGVTLDLELRRVLAADGEPQPSREVDQALRRHRRRRSARIDAAASARYIDPVLTYGDPERPREPARERRLAAPGRAVDRDDDPRRAHGASSRTPSRASVSTNPGKLTSAASMPSILEGDRAPSAATANAIAIRWSPPRVGPAALEPAARDHEVVPLVGGLPAQVADAPGERTEPVALLDPELRRLQEPRIRSSVDRERGEHGHLVDHQGELVGLDPHRTDAGAGLDLDRPDRLARPRSARPRAA